jgi:hypothetical protein
MMTPHPDIALHIGAHKTATTHLQRSVLAVRPAVARFGVQFYGPQQLRGHGKSLAARFGLRVRGNKTTRSADPKAALAQLLRSGTRLVLSEENFIGTLHNRSGTLAWPIYPHTEARISGLADRIAPGGLDIYLGIRDPARFLSSSFSQVLLGGAIVPVTEYRDSNPFARLDWADFVRRIRHTAGVRSVTVWRQEDYSAMFGQICSALLGPGAATAVAPLQQRIHQGLSEQAVAAIYEWHNAGHEGPLASLAREMYPTTPQSPLFYTYTDSELAQSRIQYAKQVAQIAEMSGVTLLRPQAEP